MSRIFVFILLFISVENAFSQDTEFKEYKTYEAKDPTKWLPDWPLFSRPWKFAPILAFRRRHVEAGDTSIDTSAAELGAVLVLKDFTLIPNNSPGLMMRPFVGYTWGYLSSETKTPQGSTDADSGYNRIWYGLQFSYLYRYYKQIVSLTLGKINYGDDFQDLRLFELSNNSGIKLREYLSVHLASTYLWVYGDKFSDQFQDSLDNWLYLQVQYEFLNTLIQFGPGVNYRKSYSYDNDTKDKISDNSQGYLLGRSRFKLIFNLELILESQYIFKASNELTGNEVIFNQLPHQDLNEPPDALSLPADSLNTYGFLGFPDIFAGIGFGYQFNYLTINYSNSIQRQTYEDQGFTAYFSLRY